MSEEETFPLAVQATAGRLEASANGCVADMRRPQVQLQRKKMDAKRILNGSTFE